MNGLQTKVFLIPENIEFPTDCALVGLNEFIAGIKDATGTLTTKANPITAACPIEVFFNKSAIFTFSYPIPANLDKTLNGFVISGNLGPLNQTVTVTFGIGNQNSAINAQTNSTVDVGLQPVNINIDNLLPSSFADANNLIFSIEWNPVDTPFQFTAFYAQVNTVIDDPGLAPGIIAAIVILSILFVGSIVAAIIVFVFGKKYFKKKFQKKSEER